MTDLPAATDEATHGLAAVPSPPAAHEVTSALGVPAVNLMVDAVKSFPPLIVRQFLFLSLGSILNVKALPATRFVRSSMLLVPDWDNLAKLFAASIAPGLALNINGLPLMFPPPKMMVTLYDAATGNEYLIVYVLVVRTIWLTAGDPVLAGSLHELTCFRVMLSKGVKKIENVSGSVWIRGFEKRSLI